MIPGITLNNAPVFGFFPRRSLRLVAEAVLTLVTHTQQQSCHRVHPLRSLRPVAEDILTLVTHSQQQSCSRVYPRRSLRPVAEAIPPLTTLNLNNDIVPGSVAYALYGLLKKPFPP